MEKFIDNFENGFFSESITTYEIERIYSYNLEEELLNRYLLVLDKCDAKLRSVILDYLNPIENYVSSKEEYNYFINKFNSLFNTQIDLIEDAIKSNKKENINKLYYIKKIISECPVKSKDTVNTIIKYFNKYCSTLKSSFININNDELRNYIIDLINICAFKESEIYNIIEEL